MPTAAEGRVGDETDNDLYARAFQAYRAGRPDEAGAWLDTVLRQAPRHARAYLLKGVVHDKAESAVGLALVEQAVHLEPDDAQAWYNLGVFEAERNALDSALAAYRRAVALDPLMLDALGNGCELLRREGQFDTALAWADRQLSLEPGAWTGHLNRAICLLHLRRFEESEAAFAAARQAAPDRPIVGWERFSLMLFQLRFAEAWDDFETRFSAGHLNGVFAYPFPQPPWTGQPLAGKRLLVHNEQGLGDQIMFACALPDVIGQASAVTLVASPELAPLLAASFPDVRVLAARNGAFAGDHPPPDWLPDLGPVDYQLPIGSLMAVLRRDEASFVGAAPYLRPSQAARDRWAGFDAGSGLRVGLCWASNPAVFRTDSARRARKKSMRLEAMAPLAAVPGVSLVSVLNWPLEDAAWARNQVQDVSAKLDSLDDTAALIERLDLVITVDTAVAHLAGALGKETWLLLHDFADCRWELQGERSYWYPCVRMFRQASPGDWPGVMARVTQALRERAP